LPIAVVTVAALGLCLMVVAGHTQSATLHDAAHDLRHATGLPCHGGRADPMIRHMLTSAAGAGLAAGILAAGLHLAFMQDLILTGETRESGAVVHFGGVAAGDAGHDHAGHDHGHAAAHDQGDDGHDHAHDNGGGVQRDLLTVAFCMLLQVAYALLLVAGLAMARLAGREVTAREGLLWGIAGFAAVQLAPSMGLAPELPGSVAADLSDRQARCWGTPVATGLAAIGHGRKPWAVALGVVLIALPHVIGAPQPEGFHGVAPPEVSAACAAKVARESFKEQGRVQGLFFAPFDLPQSGMNVTTRLLPLFALQVVAKRVIAPGTAYVDLKYSRALALSTAYRGGVAAWVAFWAFLGQGADAFRSVALSGAAYMTVVLLEPVVDLAVLAGAKALRGLQGSGLVIRRLYAP
jgi:cobalt transporter subunit CbtA